MNRVFGIFICMFTFTAICSAQSVLYFPQIADGLSGSTRWGTVVAITNTAAPGAPAASGTVVFTQDNGTPLTVPFQDEQGRQVGSGNIIPFQVPGGQTRFFISAGAAGPDATARIGELNTGFATVTSNIPVSGAVVFMEWADGQRVADAGVPAATPLTRQTILVVKNKGEGDTAVAVANPGNSTATITFQFFDTNGTATLPAVSKTLGPNNHTAFFVGEIFPNDPNAPQQLFGSMRITSDTPLVTTALVFDESGHFATFPVFPLQ